MKKLTEEKLLGRFEGISAETYHKELTYAYSNSDLSAAAISMSNVVQRRNGPDMETDALLFGRAFHARMEHYSNQDNYLGLVAVPPSVDGRTTEGKLLKKQFEESSKGKLILDAKDWDLLENMLSAVKAHPDANSLLEAKGVVEETFIWKDADTGVICKCRPDKRILEAPNGLPDNMVIDWKTAKSCDVRELTYAIESRRYHVQAAFYLDGIKAVLGHDVGPFVNVFIEKGSQLRVVLGVINDDDIETGRQIYKMELAKIAEAQKSGIWGGFVDFSLPKRSI